MTNKIGNLKNHTSINLDNLYNQRIEKISKISINKADWNNTIDWALGVD